MITDIVQLCINIILIIIYSTLAGYYSIDKENKSSFYICLGANAMAIHLFTIYFEKANLI